ncbi:uncharacterized protein LOC105446597 [Strongylocentrotus purpuratus]|uniref:Uncharacterized protein n=1 Tax=Strongylocentrotus purpuratus TaxID=7668 RepID=A0A7M7NUT0_STRPU|nr:uncharacterized protein LOC105446597 [Strongylocentrotus purpuratus]
MSGRRSSRKTRKNPPVSEQPQQPPQAEEEAQKVEEEGPSLAELTVPPPPKDDRGKGRGKKGKARDKRKRRDSHEDSDAEEVQSEAAQEEADSEDEAESEVPVTEKKRRKAKAPAVNLTPEQEEDISEWLKLNPWLWDKNEKDYRLRDTKQGGCNDKAAEMGLTAAELRRRIKTLKDIAVKALKPPPSGAGGRICTPQQQRCVELFGFLAKKVVRRPGRTTLKGVQPRPLVQVQEEVQEEEEGTDEESRIELTGDIPPQPRRRDRRRGAAIKEHEDLLEAMRRSLADSSAITQRVESALGTAAPPPTDPRLLERHTYGQWLMSILPSIADDHWFAFRRDINKIVDILLCCAPI